jgi:glycosyltransferase involved in cell wall biosynthesis
MISVIIPAYNAEKYIRTCLKSVEAQTYTDYEIILVDDGSTDLTHEIVKNEFPRVHYYKVINGGAAKARNYGIDRAKGEYLAFIDIDDQWLNSKLEQQVKFLESHPDFLMVFTDNYFVSENGETLKKTNKSETLIHGDLVRNIFWHSEVCTPTVMIKPETIKAVGKFNEQLITSEDDNFWMRIAEKGEVGLISEPLVTVVVRNESLSRGEVGSTNLYKGVLQHIRLIKNEYPTIYKRLGNLINWKYRKLYFSYGYACIQYGNIKGARIAFAKAIMHGEITVRAMLYLGLTFFGIRAVHFAQKKFGNP